MNELPLALRKSDSSWAWVWVLYVRDLISPPGSRQVTVCDSVPSCFCLVRILAMTCTRPVSRQQIGASRQCVDFLKQVRPGISRIPSLILVPEAGLKPARRGCFSPQLDVKTPESCGSDPTFTRPIRGACWRRQQGFYGQTVTLAAHSPYLTGGMQSVGLGCQSVRTHLRTKEFILAARGNTKSATVQDLIRCALALGVGINDLWRASDPPRQEATEG